jgi:hypothetical protein
METTLRTFLNGYLQASKHNDASLLSTVLTPTCTRKFLPASFLSAMGAPPDLALDVKAYEDHWTTQMRYVQAVRLDVTHLAVDTGNMTAAARSVYVDRFVTGEEMVLDMAWFLRFEEGGERVTEVVQFADGLEFVKFEAKVKEIREAMEKQQ